jgi:SAM-dependent methyltransferase
MAAADPFQGREPTSHERMTGLPWDASYQDGPAPWDVGRPQPAIARVAGDFIGPVLDVGCGTGDNALLIAGLGLSVLGVDVAETAVRLARARAAGRGIVAEFAVADAFRLGELGRRFKTVVDSGMLHTLDAEERPRYVASLASAIDPGGTLYVLAFSDEGPDAGPHPVTREELTAAFGQGWDVVSLESDRVLTRYHDDHGAPAWLAIVRRVPSPT